MFNKVRVSLQTSIILLLVLLIIPLSSLIIIITYISSTDSVERLSDNLMESISSQTVDKSLSYLKPARRGLELSRGLSRANILKGDKIDEVENYFRQLLTQYPEFIMLNYGLENGNFMMVKRMPDGSYSSKWIRREGDKAFTQWIHEKPEWESVFQNQVEPVDKAYDPRKRPWYIKAKSGGRATWTDAYIFYSDRKPGIACACPIYSLTTKKLIGVVSVDMGIEEISKFIGGLEIGKRGKAFIINHSGELVAYPVKTEDDLAKLVHEKVVNGEKQIFLPHILNCKDMELANSYEALMFAKNASKHSVQLTKRHDVRFEYNGEHYIGAYTPFPKKSGWKWNIGIIVPENDFMGQIKRNNIITLIISLIALVLSLGIGILLARKITKPLAKLSEEAQHIRDLDLTQREPVESNLIEIMNMSQSLDNMKNGLRSFEKYVPAELVRLLVHSGLEANLGVKKKELTIFFSDIAGFTKISEQLNPEILVNSLGEYLNELSAIIHNQYGTVDKYIGDAIMAFWNAPRPVENHALQACRAALRCHAKLQELNTKWSQAGLPPFNTRFGIHTGEVLVGNIGCDVRMDYTVIGDNVNLASRLEGINKVYGTNIIISGDTSKLVNEDLAVRILDYVSVAGKSEATAIYEIICEKQQLAPEKELFITKYTNALDCYINRKWDEAITLFNEASAMYPHDLPCKILIQRCEQYSIEPPPEDWTGVYTLTKK